MWLCVALWCESTHNVACDWGTYHLIAKSVFYSDSLYYQFRAIFDIFQIKLFI